MPGMTLTASRLAIARFSCGLSDIVLSLGLLVASIAGIGGMFSIFSACPLNQVRPRAWGLES